MVIVIARGVTKSYGFLFWLVFFLFSLPLQAIDNPDAPDLVAEFIARSATYEEMVGMSGGGGREIARAYGTYLNFLDKELNTAYGLLMSKLPSSQQQALRDSQRMWLAFRDAEFQFIVGNWTRDRFGTSAYISVGDYRSSLVKERIIQLLHYTKNYL
ncbi:MAG: lysozyme inhibitor LprI family protein [Chromatiales bacterium]|jgi:uncharacterized protein YecT (DUF1311 family)